MPSSFLSRRSYFRTQNALLILLVVFFLVPFAFRGARLSLEKTENNVKDWLPNDFVETSELSWFAQYFSGERFVLLTWEGCLDGDAKLDMFVNKMAVESEEGRSRLADELPDYQRAQEIAREYGLLLPEDLRRNWGGADEIWLASTSGNWFYLLPDGTLYRWEGRQDIVGAFVGSVRRIVGGPALQGQLIGSFARTDPSLGEVNPYYNRPYLLTVPLLKTVRSGTQMVEELSGRDGPFYPVDFSKPEYKQIVARRAASETLTGTLFAPTVPSSFDWTSDAFVAAFPAKAREALPNDFRDLVDTAVSDIVQSQFQGDLERLRSAKEEDRSEVWFQVFDAIKIDPPPRKTAILVTMTQTAQENLPYVLGRGVLGAPVGRIYQLARESGIEPPPPPVMAPPPFDRMVAKAQAIGPELHVGGPPLDNISIDEEGSVTLVRLVGYCAALGLFLSYWCFRNFKITLMIFFVGVVSAAASLSLVWWTGSGVDAILMSMPSLVYVLGLSSAIHIVNYYREEVEASGVKGAAGRALAHGWGPCLLASLTTAIGLLSLYTSNIIPIRKFGLYSAIGVVATVAVLFLYLPAALEVFVPEVDRKKKRAKQTGPEPIVQSAGVGRLADLWEAIGRWIVGHYRLVTVACVAIFALTAIGLPKIQTSVQLLKLFSPSSRIIQDYGWIEQNYGKLVPMEVVLRIPPQRQQDRLDATEQILGGREVAIDPHAHSLIDRIRLVQHVQESITDVFGERGQNVVGKAMSLATLNPNLPSPGAGLDSVRGGYYGRLFEKQNELLTSDYLTIEKNGPLIGSELWRINLRVGALSDVNYGDFVKQLPAAVRPVLDAYQASESIFDIRPVGKRLQVLVLTAKENSNSSDSALSGGAIDQRFVFTKYLKRLLGENPKVALNWSVASIGLDGRAQVDEQKLMNALTKFDAVVLMTDRIGIDSEQIANASSNFFDLRDYQATKTQIELVDGVPVVGGGGAIQPIYTGVIPVVYKAQNTLLSSLIDSIGWAFVLIAGVMVVLLNPGRPVLGMLKPSAILFGIGAGLVAMIPNVFPVVLIFGSMGHLGTLVDIGTMMTASVAMGVAVDDTIHFLSWLRRSMDSGLDRHEALIQTYRRVGPAMMQTTIVGGLGLFVFALSTFTPTQKFGTLMLMLLLAALLGDLVFLPALLAGPLGKLFRARPGIQGGHTNKTGEHSTDENLQEAESMIAPVSIVDDTPQVFSKAERSPTKRPWVREDVSHRSDSF